MRGARPTGDPVVALPPAGEAAERRFGKMTSARLLLESDSASLA